MDDKQIHAAIEQYIHERGKPPSGSTLRLLLARRGISIGGSQADRIMQKWREENEIKLNIERKHTLTEWHEYPQIAAPVLVLSDLHIPYQDASWIERAANYALRRKIRRLLIAGDLLDAKALSVFPSNSPYSFEDELEEGVAVVEALARRFETHIILGNHDDRVAKKLDRELSAHTIYRMAFRNAQIHRHHQAFVGRSWLIAHPRNYSRITGQPAHALAAKYQRHVAIAHTHKWSLTRDVSGGSWIIETGGCFDARHLDYIHRELSTMPFPQRGALLINADEQPLLLHPELAFNT